MPPIVKLSPDEIRVASIAGISWKLKRFDENRGENFYSLHIINSDDDLGERIGQIVTIELLRN